MVLYRCLRRIKIHCRLADLLIRSNSVSSALWRRAASRWRTELSRIWWLDLPPNPNQGSIQELVNVSQGEGATNCVAMTSICWKGLVFCCCLGHVHLCQQQRWKWQRDVGIYPIQGKGYEEQLQVDGTFTSLIYPKDLVDSKRWLEVFDVIDGVQIRSTQEVEINSVLEGASFEIYWSWNILHSEGFPQRSLSVWNDDEASWDFMVTLAQVDILTGFRWSMCVVWWGVWKLSLWKQGMTGDEISTVLLLPTLAMCYRMSEGLHWCNICTVHAFWPADEWTGTGWKLKFEGETEKMCRENGLTARMIGPGRDGQRLGVRDEMNGDKSSDFGFGYRITCCQHHNVFYAQHTFKVAEVKAWSSERKLGVIKIEVFWHLYVRCTSVARNSKDFSGFPIDQIAQEAKFVFPPSVWHHSVSRAMPS